MNRVVHFEIQADDTARAIKFYKDIFAWDFQKWDAGDKDYWMVMTADKDTKEKGINGGLMQRPEVINSPRVGANAFVCTILVDNFDDMAKKILAAGGKVVVEKMAIAGMAWQGYFLDSEKNVFGIHQPDKNAK